MWRCEFVNDGGSFGGLGVEGVGLRVGVGRCSDDEAGVNKAFDSDFGAADLFHLSESGVVLVGGVACGRRRVY